MAGGTWIDQNKVRPGVYINYKSAPASLATMGERGTVAIARVMDWGAQGKFYTIESPSDCAQLGHAITDPEMLFVRQILLGSNRTQGATKILVWSLNTTGGQRASATLLKFVVTALYTGTFGNRLSADITQSGSDFIVQTYLDGVVVDSQTVTDASELVANDYVTFSGDIEATVVRTALTGGTNGTAGATDYSAFLDALELQRFDIVIYDGTDATIKTAFADFVKRLSNQEGVKCQAVLSDATNPDNECIINVYPQAVTLTDGTELAASELTWWVGGASAGANVFESLTYAAYPDAVEVDPVLTSSQQEAAINAGKFALITQFDRIQVLTDINSFVTFAVEKGKAFRKNRVIRTVFGLCNDIYKTFATYYIGAVHNDEEGRNSLKAEILNLMNRYQGNRALQNVEADDVTVLAGVDSDAVVIEIYIQPVDSVEKIYINITIS
jgi:hypothetical protein